MTLARYEAFTVVMFQVRCSVHPEYGGSLDLWNVGILQQHWTASQPRRPRLQIEWHWFNLQFTTFCSCREVRSH